MEKYLKLDLEPECQGQSKEHKTSIMDQKTSHLKTLKV